MALRRLQYECKKFAQERQDAPIKAGPIDEENLYCWWATIEGPVGTPFENGVFRILIEYSTEYPFKPPKMRLETKIFHPNISSAGEISVDILQDQWSPAVTTAKLLLAIRSILGSPILDDPIELEIASLYMNLPQEYRRIARTWTDMYATGNARATVSTDVSAVNKIRHETLSSVHLPSYKGRAF